MKAILVLGAIAVATAGVGAGHSGALREAAKSATFRDTVGETTLGPDIGTIVVSNDDRGILTFRVEIPSHSELTEDMRIRIWLDSDGNRNTGLETEGLRGADNFLLVDRWEYGLGEVVLFACSGSTCSGGKAVPTGSGTSLRFSYEDGAATFAVDAADLGIERLGRIRFWTEVWTGIGFDPVTRRYDFTNARADFAPNGAGRRVGDPGAQGEDSWTYDARTMLVRSFTAQPAKPRAGRPFALRLALISTDTGAAVTSGAVSCSMRIAGKLLRPQSRGFVGGRAACMFAIPADARGRTFQSAISVRYAGEKVTRSLSGRVSPAG